MEVQNQSDLVTGDPEIGQQLGTMHREYVLDGLDLHDHGIFYHEFEAIGSTQIDTLLLGRDLGLPGETDATQPEFLG